jgi:hypothetical protein
MNADMESYQEKHMIELWWIDSAWHYRIDTRREFKHSGCGTEPSLEDAIREAGKMLISNRQFRRDSCGATVLGTDASVGSPPIDPDCTMSV